jgi:hypothetical protein
LLFSSSSMGKAASRDWVSSLQGRGLVFERWPASPPVSAPSVEEVVVESIPRVGVPPDVLAETARLARLQLAEIVTAASARFGLGDHDGVRRRGFRRHRCRWCGPGQGVSIRITGKVSGIWLFRPRGMISRMVATVSSSALASVSLLAGQADSRRPAGLEAG